MPPSHLTWTCALALLLASPRAGWTQPSLDTVLGRPVGPTAEVLLVAHGNDPRVQERWRGASCRPGCV